jgi:hypothetical protein
MIASLNASRPEFYDEAPRAPLQKANAAASATKPGAGSLAIHPEKNGPTPAEIGVAQELLVAAPEP